MPHRCNKCGNEWSDILAAENDFVCTRKCGGELVSAGIIGNNMGPTMTLAHTGRHFTAIPSILAISLHEFETEKHPVMKLWHACDAVELTLRFVVIVGLADLARRGPLPDALLRELRDRIEKPSLGKWQGMAEAVIRFLSQGEPGLPELGPLVKDHLASLLDGQSMPRTATTSLSALRNHLAHGGGVTRAAATRLLDTWQPRIAAFVDALAWTADISLVVRTPAGRTGILRGPQPQPEPWQPPESVVKSVTTAFARGDEVLLVRGDNVLTLWPLTLFGHPRNADPDVEPSSEVLFQVYVRRGDVQLQFTPLGSDACLSSEGDISAYDAFRILFRLDAALVEEREKGFGVRGFEKELHKDADDLVGRARDLDTIRQKLAEHRNGGVLWLTGPAGIGKSYLVAGIATELLDKPPEGTLVLAYRFKAGDDRCSRASFLHFALERLRTAIPEAPEQDDREGTGKDDDSKQDSSVRVLLEALKKRLSALANKKILFILDGLDEIVERDASFAADVPLALTLPDVAWLCSGRPERGLPELFSTEKCVHVFPDSVPPMETEDVRTMLLEQIGPLRKRLLANDREQGDQVNNAFVSKVADCAQGLPLYVRYVVNDIKGLKLRVLDAGERLPPSLDRYHEELLRRCAVGILHQVVTPLVATLAVAQEPLAATALSEILARGNVLPDDEYALPLVRRALAAVASMIRRGMTPDGNDGYVLFHHSLRQHMETSTEMAPAIKTARRNLANLAEQPGDGPAAPYLYRRGVSHLLETNRRDEALAVLSNFAYSMTRLRTLAAPEGIRGLLTDWQTAVVGQLNADQRIWEAFFRERAHLLRRGNDRWPAYKILLQLAVEHADDSPVTKQAEAWLEQGHCDWLWLRNPMRIPHSVPDPCRLMLEGHTDEVNGALVLPNNDILSWSRDNKFHVWNIATGDLRHVFEGSGSLDKGPLVVLPDGSILLCSAGNTLQIWDTVTGDCRPVLEGHTGRVSGALLLSDGKILSWSDDMTLRIWDTKKETCIKLEGHKDGIIGALVLPDGAILSWSEDDTLRVWDIATRKSRVEFKGHTDGIESVFILPDDHVVSCSRDKTLQVWNHKTGVCRARIIEDYKSKGNGELTEIEGYWGRGVLVLSNGGILSWGVDYTLRIWDSLTEKVLAAMEGHSDRVTGALVLPSGGILSWSNDTTLRIWDPVTGVCQIVLRGHTDRVSAVLLMRDGSILSWSADKTLRVWDMVAGSCRAVFKGHTGGIGGVSGAMVLSGGRILSWSGASINDNTLRVWNITTGECLKVLDGHCGFGGIKGVRVLEDGCILSWADDKTLRVWDIATRTCRELLEKHSHKAKDVLVLSDGGVLSWTWDNNLRVWDATTGACHAIMKGHTQPVFGVLVLPGGEVLSWALDNTLRIWNATTGMCRKVLEGHTGFVTGAKVLPDGSILSWFNDMTLKVWDAEKGTIRAELKGHTKRIKSALVLPGGDVLSWSDDETLRVWDILTGECRSVVSEDDAPFDRPDLLRVRSSNLSGDISTPQGWAIGALGNAVVLSSFSSPLRMAWQADCPCHGKTVFPDGTVVTTLDDGHVIFLKLYHGDRRVNLAEALTRFPYMESTMTDLKHPNTQQAGS